MCYLVAKEFGKRGSIAIRMEHGKHLSDFVRELNDQLGGWDNTRIELVTISRPAAYGEYAPYTRVTNEGEFRKKVLAM